MYAILLAIDRILWQNSYRVFTPYNYKRFFSDGGIPMFLKYKVDIPVVPGKLVRKNRGGHTYIEYEYDRIYDPVKRKCLKTWRSVN